MQCSERGGAPESDKGALVSAAVVPNFYSNFFPLLTIPLARTTSVVHRVVVRSVSKLHNSNHQGIR